MKFLLSSFISIYLLLLSLIPILCSPCYFPSIFNFGDSNSDTGGLAAAYPPLPPPFGVSFFKMPAGRYTDGRLVIDFIAESFRLPFLSAYLDSLGTNFSHGANFATAASTIVLQNASLFQGGYSPFFLHLQLSQFFELKAKSQILKKRGGVFRDLMPKKEYFSQALYTFDIGQNDITALYDQNTPKEIYIPNALKQLSAVITSIYKKGGRYFWIHNTGPLGCLPYALLRLPPELAQLDSVGCSIFFNELAQEYNTKLSEAVALLRMKLPLATLILVDIYSVKYSLINQATKLGFEQPLKACCGFGGGKYNFDFVVRCGYPVNVNGTQQAAKLCENPAKRIIWDGIHYTEAANKFVFDQISEGKFSKPPLGLSMACKRMMG